MKTPYIQGIHRFDVSTQAIRALETLRFIVAQGGSLDRWRSLIIHTKVPQVLFEAVKFINSAPTPALQFLSLKWKADIGTVIEAQELDSLGDIEDMLGDSYALSHGSQRPQLRRVDLGGLPAAFIFDRPSPLLSNLTRLKLVCASQIYSIQGISALLSASPQLEHLSLDLGHAEGNLGIVTTGPLQISLPALRFFSLNPQSAYDWGVYLLQTIDAPGVETFELRTGTQTLMGDFDSPTFAFLCLGRKNGALLHNGVNGGSTDYPKYGPPFPSLRHLDIKHINSTGRHTILRLLESYPMITQITLSFSVLSALAERPNLLPNLRHLKYSDIRRSSFPGTMQKIAQGRVQAEMRLPFVEVEFTGRARPGWHGESGEMVVDYKTRLNALVDKLVVYDRENHYVPDSDDETGGGH
jgi:hypothetical protein